MSKNKRLPSEPPPVRSGTNSAAPRESRLFIWFGIVLIALAIFTRIRLLDIPFERDEGAFAYIGREFWGSGRLYTDLYDNKLPGLYLIYAIFVSLFGATPFGVHCGALIWHIATLAVFYFWLREVFGKDKAVACTGLYAFYAASAEVLGFAVHATQLCTLPAIAGLWALWRGTIQEKKPRALWFLLAGLGAGLSIWIKQQAFFYALFGISFLIWWFIQSGRQISFLKIAGSSALYLLGVVLPAGLSAAWFATQGRLDDFWFWTVQLSAGQAAETSNGWFFFRFYFPKVVQGWWLLWIAGVGGCIYWMSRKDMKGQRMLAPLLPFALLGTAIGGAFYPHYFVLVTPWLACCAVVGLDALVRRFGTAGWLAAGLVVISPLLLHLGYWVRDDFRTIMRYAYGNDPFTEMAAIGKELKKRCGPSDSIAVIGSEPELFLYTGKPSALGHLFFQAVLQDHPRRQQFQNQVREAFWKGRPRFVVLPSAQYEFIKDDPLTREIVASLQKDYHSVCVVEINEKKSSIVWDPAPEKSVPAGLFWVMVLERNPAAQQ